MTTTEIIQPGTYRARAIEGALGFTKGGKEQVAVQFDLLDFEGQRITWYGYFTENTTQSTFRALRSCGWTGSDLSDLSELSNPNGPEVYLVIEHETYEGKTTAKVRWVNGASGLAMKNAMAPDQAKAFAARMQAQLAAFDAATKQAEAAPAKGAAPKNAKPAAAPKKSDDIPF